MTKKIWVITFGALAIVLLPVTCFWALCAYLAGDKDPLFTLRGKNVDDPIDTP